jgi:hypothetical protein
MVSVSMTVPAMHEQMQYGAQEKQDIREYTENMRPVFHNQKKCSNGKECE